MSRSLCGEPAAGPEPAPAERGPGWTPSGAAQPQPPPLPLPLPQRELISTEGVRSALTVNDLLRSGPDVDGTGEDRIMLDMLCIHLGGAGGDVYSMWIWRNGNEKNRWSHSRKKGLLGYFMLISPTTKPAPHNDANVNVSIRFRKYSVSMCLTSDISMDKCALL